MTKAVTQINYYYGASGSTTTSGVSASSLKFNTEDTIDGTSPVYRPSTFFSGSGPGTAPYAGSFTGISSNVLSGVAITGVTLTGSELVGGALLVVSASSNTGSIGLISANTSNTITIGSWLSGSAPTLTSGTGTFTIARGTNFSWPKAIALHVSTAGVSPTTTIFNRKIALDTNATVQTGVSMYWAARSTYTQSSASLVQANETTSSSSAGTLPVTSGWTWNALSTSYATYDAADGTSSIGRNGSYVYLSIGVSSSYTSGPSSAVALPNIKIQYDER